MCYYVAYNRSYKRRFLHLYLLFFISLYAKIKCLQHSLTYYGRVTLHLFFFINVIVTALFDSQNGQTTRYIDWFRPINAHSAVIAYKIISPHITQPLY